MPVGNRRTAGPLALLLLSVLAAQTSLHLARPLISYRVIALGGDALAVGLITSAYALLSLVVALPLGRYTDRTGRTVAVLLGGTFLLATGAALLGVSSSLPALGASSAVLGFGHIAFMLGGPGFTLPWGGTAISTAISACSPPRLRAANCSAHCWWACCWRNSPPSG